MRVLALLALLAAGPALADGFSPDMSAVPAPSVSLPPAAALDSQLGASALYARADHTHAARVQRIVITTAADGTAKWTFARPIAVPAGKLPPIAYMVEDTGTPVVVQVVGRELTSDGTTDTHTSVSIKAQRSRTLPAVLVALTNLVAFDVFGGAASGVKVNLFAGDPTQ
ncbi:hypothetical protein [Methylobacterium organophilum]|uniref:Uncharacterized protein n=1 Tax=Methylobacterium organophilum TaxID=410 RepID=A0ABQ4TDP5_METOR|nr:hypothetical protein [Methylobacterium organophilum]GJE29802.1 hypothetical protein LKMONMHP_4688 [Methylobacterium organophilum]